NGRRRRRERLEAPPDPRSSRSVRQDRAGLDARCPAIGAACRARHFVVSNTIALSTRFEPGEMSCATSGARMLDRISARGRFWLATVALTVVTVGSFVAVTLRLHLEPNVASLLPERGDAAALRRYVRAFGGGDLAVVMIKGDDADKNVEA